jgi:D-alanyl-D-alanine carboxypeptidase/D-alanyl-D-alanine-endopeptidase (penicillin-binding protein 4)
MVPMTPMPYLAHSQRHLLRHAKPASPGKILRLASLSLLAVVSWLPGAPGAAQTPGAQSPRAQAPAITPALPSRYRVRPPRLATLPPLPPPLATPAAAPLLQSELSCPPLQQRITRLIGPEADVWSVTVADGRGRLLADVNGTRSRLPASNQKLISTAYALDRLGPDFRLSTQLWRLPDGRLRLTGQGDPDLALPQLQRLTRMALLHSGASASNPARLELAEEQQQVWWPQGWHWGDRSTAYGAPVTRLAVTSNTISEAVMNPPARLVTLLRRSVASQAPGAITMSVVSAREPIPANAVLVHEEPSTSMFGLLSLANTESHNFTAEVLLRSAAGTWDETLAAQRTMEWLQQQGLPLQGVRVRDGSGLDRGDRVTSRFITALLLRMDQHPYARQYVGSMAIAGQRGTLRHLFNGTSLDGRLYAKTGTLTGVRAISGVLQTADGPRFVSAISNGAAAPNRTIGQVLQQVQNVGLCGSSATAALPTP